MRQVKDILRLKHFNQLSVRDVARSCGLPVSTVGDYLQRAEAAGFSIGELNQAIRRLVDKLNAQPFQKLDGSRNSWFDAQEKDKLLPLPPVFRSPGVRRFIWRRPASPSSSLIFCRSQ